MLWVSKPAARREGRKDLHKNAGSCPKSRAVLVRRVVEEGWAVREGAEAQGLCVRRTGGWHGTGCKGLQDWRIDRVGRTMSDAGLHPSGLRRCFGCVQRAWSVRRSRHG
jgi:hypothetical protein